MRTKRTFENFKQAVANESKRFYSLKKFNGQFNEKYLRMGFDSKMTARQFCNSMTENT